ncbi:MAG TPA: CAP domain-containing protein [Armatimonadota bacterium]|jgi:uncharacterized protein YkwD
MHARFLLLAWLLFSFLTLPGLAAGSGCATLSAKWSCDQFPGQEAIERAVVTLTNAERSKAGVRQVTVESALQTAARQHSGEMGAQNYFAHESPVELWRKPWQRTYYAGYWGQEVGENIASVENGHFTTPESIAAHFMNLWMTSPSHKANLLRADWKIIGVGFVKCGNTYFGTQEFANPLVTLEEATLTRVSGEMVVARLDGTRRSGDVDIWVDSQHYKTISPTRGEWSATVSYPRHSGCYEVAVSVGQEIVWSIKLDTDNTESPLRSERAVKGKVVNHADADIVPFSGLKLHVVASVPATRQPVCILQDDQPCCQPTVSRDRHITFDQILPERSTPYTLTFVVNEQAEELLYIDTKKPLAEAFRNRLE